MENGAALHAIVSGHVQGVYFRAFVEEKAKQLGLTGYVRNVTDREAVEVQTEGEKAQLEAIILHLKKGPPHARVDSVATEWIPYTGKYSEFEIRYD